VKYRCDTQGRDYGRAYFDPHSTDADFIDHESDDSETDGSDNYQYYCPECDEEVDESDLFPVPSTQAAPPVVTSEPVADVFDYRWVHGMHVVADIGENENVPCVVTIERGSVYLCQNEVAGSDCHEKQGMQYSWCLGTGTPTNCISNDVQNIRRASGHVPKNIWSNLV
jgi:hypothetical protein